MVNCEKGHRALLTILPYIRNYFYSHLINLMFCDFINHHWHLKNIINIISFIMFFLFIIIIQCFLMPFYYFYIRIILHAILQKIYSAANHYKNS